jgi:hypothetical protein
MSTSVQIFFKNTLGIKSSKQDVNGYPLDVTSVACLPDARRMTSSTNACTFRSKDPPAARATALHDLALARMESASGPATAASTASRTTSRRSGARRADAHPELLHQELGVRALVAPLREGYYGHAGGHGLERGAPAAVREEARGGGVRLQALLRAPRHHHAAARDGVQEPLREQRASVRAHYPQEWPVRGREPVRHLGDLLGGQHHDAADRRVRDGARGLRVEPPHEVVGSFEHVTAHRVAAVLLELDERAHGDELRRARRDARELGEHAALELGEGVDEHPRRPSMLRNWPSIAAPANSFNGLDGSRNDGASAVDSGGKPGSATRASGSSSGGSSTSPRA